MLNGCEVKYCIDVGVTEYIFACLGVFNGFSLFVMIMFDDIDVLSVFSWFVG